MSTILQILSNCSCACGISALIKPISQGSSVGIPSEGCDVHEGLELSSNDSQEILIYGAGENCEKLLTYFSNQPQLHINIVGIFDDRQTRISVEPELLQGNMDDMLERMRCDDSSQIIITLPEEHTTRINQIVSRLADYSSGLQVYRDQASIPLIAWTDSISDRLVEPIAGWRGAVKSVIDKIGAAMLLCALSPILLLLSVAVAVESRGPVFFLQKRQGLGGQLFTIYKFRTIYSNQTDLDAETLVTQNDPRVTRIGHFLRKYCLDELPQLINVVIGDMSLVGPRPHATAAKAGGRLYEDVVLNYANRHRVRPGITGWAQINGWRGSTDTEEQIEQRVKHDLYYIRNWNLLLDSKILLRTVGAVIGNTQQSGKLHGIYRKGH